MKIRRLMLIKDECGSVLDVVEGIQYTLQSNSYNRKYMDAEIICLPSDLSEVTTPLTCSADFINPITFFLFKAGVLSKEATSWLVDVLDDNYNRYSLLYNILAEALEDSGIKDNNVDFRVFKGIFKEKIEGVLDNFQMRLEEL